MEEPPISDLWDRLANDSSLYASYIMLPRYVRFMEPVWHPMWSGCTRSLPMDPSGRKWDVRAGELRFRNRLHSPVRLWDMAMCLLQKNDRGSGRSWAVDVPEQVCWSYRIRRSTAGPSYRARADFRQWNDTTASACHRDTSLTATYAALHDW